MRLNLLKNPALVLFVSFLLVQAGAGAAANVDWTDRKEYDLVLTIRSESAPQKRLALLDSWSQSYPKTALARARQELYLDTYQSLGDHVKMFETAKQIQASQPEDPVALYWLTVLAPQQPNNPATVDIGEKAAKGVLAALDKNFAADKKPSALSDADWQKQRTGVEVIGHRTLGWASWQRGNLSAAADEFMICVQKDSGNAEISSWLGIVSAIDTGKQPQALWYLARSTNKDIATPLPDDQRRQVNSILENMYASYHGSLEGLDELRKVSLSKAIPPPEFSIDPATVVNARRAEMELSMTNPELAAWLSMHRQLTAPDGEKYFASDVQGKPLPKLRGTVLRASPLRAPREIVLSMSESNQPDVTLKLTVPLTRPAPAGANLSFQGVGVSFTKEPFSLIITADTAQPESRTQP
jgi:hypothetical protein